MKNPFFQIGDKRHQRTRRRTPSCAAMAEDSFDAIFAPNPTNQVGRKSAIASSAAAAASGI